MGCIYVATNIVNGKQYVGKSKHNMESRKEGHEKGALNGASWLIHRALRKYGFDAFVWDVACDSLDDEDLDVYERATIRKLKTKMPNGYNMTDGGDGVPNLPASIRAAMADKISKALKGREKTPEHLQAISRALTGRKLTDEHKAAVSKGRAGIKQTPESNHKRSVAQTGKTKICKVCSLPGHNRRTCPLLSDVEKAELPKRSVGTLKGKTYDEIYGDKADHYRQLRGGRKSEQARKKMSEAAKRREQRKRDSLEDT